MTRLGNPLFLALATGKGSFETDTSVSEPDEGFPVEIFVFGILGGLEGSLEEILVRLVLGGGIGFILEAVYLVIGARDFCS